MAFLPILRSSGRLSGNELWMNFANADAAEILKRVSEFDRMPRIPRKLWGKQNDQGKAITRWKGVSKTESGTQFSSEVRHVALGHRCEYRIIFHGAPLARMMPNGCLEVPCSLALRS